ncbi:HesB-like domain containing protein [Trichomonas vaginalis G3]|uniref:HesB-like domain containing protein n=1 Tax=Trichomonas vaginalis (strain ATCC PRA-98 / G3) TaxID=412133 RepID=A2FQN1_TRIV3|nr:protein maturation by iron-sulfur cluster transfer [Trichomonas vaginalis G3]EAX92774.1 HesB-like domain containing protein [Trichomonas vaginalis G3]KAI5524680.1 protein maturation by iron-sulfur cluster transfer [Trichomonas vaginalis G3]|eukprot:XP_001305704.1 HesB-like domain containing protein [Trichomonas vaginalis G3]
MLSQAFRAFAQKKPAFDMTPSAVAQIKKLLKGDFENKMLRIGLKSGGCAGFQYDFSFDNAARKGDHLFKKDGAQVVLDDKALLYLRNSTLDFTSDRFSSTFKIVLPTESNLHSCSCGKSVGGDGDHGECGHH